MSKILITGATGHLGKAVTEQILKRAGAGSLHIMARDAAKAAAFEKQGVKVRIGDYNDINSLVAAFQGIDKVYMVSGNDLPNRIPQQGNVVDAAVKAGVKHVVYTSFQRKNETDSSPIGFVAKGHLFTEQKLKASGLTYTILEHGIYADMIPIFAGEQLMQTHTIYLPAGEGKTAYALRADQAEAGAIILLDNSGKYDNKSIELTGSESIGWARVAEIISEASHQSIKYVSPSEEEFKATLSKAGVPAEYVGLFTGFSIAAKQGEFANVSHDLEKILNRKPISVSEFLKGVYSKQELV